MRLYTRKNATGVSWCVDFSIVDPQSGRRRRKRAVLRGVKTEAEARRIARALEARLKTTDESVRAGAAFEELAQRWTEAGQRRWSRSTWRAYEQILRVHILPRFSGRLASSITTEDVERYLRDKLVAPRGRGDLSAKTVNNHLGLLSKLFKDAVRWGEIDQDPTAGVAPCPRDKDDEMNVLTVEQAERLLKEVRTRRPKLHALFFTALHTGLRLGELAALRPDDIDLEARILHVRRSLSHGEEKLPKSNKTRQVPLNSALEAVLRAHLPTVKGGRVFLSLKGEPITHNRVKSHLRTACRRAEVPEVRFHDLRHTFATHLIQADVGVRKVQRLLGHADVKTTERYAHVPLDDLRDAVERIPAKGGRNRRQDDKEP